MKPTSSITVFTQDYETDMYSSGETAGFYSVDYTEEQLTFVCLWPNAITNAAVIRSVTTTGSDSQYTFTF